MRLNATRKSTPPAGALVVDWHDCAWIPAIVVRTMPGRFEITNPLPASVLVLHTGRRRLTSFKFMKTPSLSMRRPRAGFTLIELLVVIAIIGILAAMLLAVLPAVMNSGKKTKARLEAQAIATAIEQYDSAYGRFPVSVSAQNAAAALGSGGGDFTYGGTFQKTDGSTQQIGTVVGASVLTNSEVIAILMNLTNYPTGGSTINTNYQKNPQKTIFLNAKMSGWDGTGTPIPGVDNNLVYRDPWGNPYVISMDLNYDDQTEDALYARAAVSQQTVGKPQGYGGLVNTDPIVGSDHFHYHGKVMVWSAGPDKKVDPGTSSPGNANTGANKDNVTSW